MKRTSFLAAAALITAAPVVFAQASYKTDLPEALLKKATVAAHAAKKDVPKRQTP
jgi:hypothetical protein